MLVLGIMKCHYCEGFEIVFNNVLYFSSQFSLSRFINYSIFLGAIAKLRKAAIKFVMFVCPSIRKENLDSHRTTCHKFHI
jgi:hypothetical protein